MEPSRAVSPPTPAKRALLVDPDPETLRYLQDRLGASNLQIRVCGSAADAMDRLSREKIDLVVSGIDLADELRGSIPAIFLVRQGVGRTMFDPSGPYRMLEMPILMSDLYTHVEAALGMKVHWEAYRTAPRLPISLEISVVFMGRTDTVISIKAKTLDLSMDGLKFERTMCQICTGYEKGGVHPDCILAKYSWTKPGSEPVGVKLHLSGNRTLELRAKVVSTLIEEGSPREFIGLRFVEMAPDQRDRLRAILTGGRG